MRARWTAPAGLILAAAAFFAGPVAAQAPSRECSASTPERPFANRTATIAAFEQLPESCLKALMVECSEVADQRILDMGSAALCSMGYEALLRKAFGGSFHAMMAWWQRERGSWAVP